MSLLPYFRWFPADATQDEKYSMLNDQQLGFFHRCLNYAWANNGLPKDTREIAALMRVSDDYMAEVWVRVGKCWYEDNGRLYNPRQEKEREHAIALSTRNKRDGNTNASRQKRDRVLCDAQRAYESESVSESVSESSPVVTFKKKPSLSEVNWPADFDFEAWFAARYKKHPIPGKPQLAKDYAMEHVFIDFQPADFDEMHDAWCEYWNTNGGIPSLAVFIWESWYRKKPPAKEVKPDLAEQAKAYAREEERRRAGTR